MWWCLRGLQTIAEKEKALAALETRRAVLEQRVKGTTSRAAEVTDLQSNVQALEAKLAQAAAEHKDKLEHLTTRYACMCGRAKSGVCQRSVGDGLTPRLFCCGVAVMPKNCRRRRQRHRPRWLGQHPGRTPPHPPHALLSLLSQAHSTTRCTASSSGVRRRRRTSCSSSLPCHRCATLTALARLPTCLLPRLPLLEVRRPRTLRQPL